MVWEHRQRDPCNLVVKATETLKGPQMAELVIYLSAGGQAVSHEDVSSFIFSRNGRGEPNQCLGFG